MHIVELLAGHKVTEFPLVYDRPVYEVFMHLVYMEDKAIEERRAAMMKQKQ